MKSVNRVLIVDDEPSVRKIVESCVKLLRGEAEVVLCQSGDHAWQEYHRHGKGFDLIISDFNMPGVINGVQLIEMIRAVDPKIRAVLMSGSVEPKHNAHAFIAKPAQITHILEVIRRVIAENPV